MLKWKGELYRFDAFSALADALAARRPINSPSFLFNLQKGILDHFFGMEWLEKFGSKNSPTHSYLRAAFDEADEAADFSMRLLNLAEMLWNLQDVVGVRNPLGDIANGQIEPGLAELQAGMLLMRNGRQFRYVDRISGRRTYDMEIQAANQTWPAEVKCKIDSTELSDATIVSALRTAHDQLPPDDAGGGIVFLRCPRSWVANEAGGVKIPRETITAVNDYLRSTRRIGLVAYYVFQYERRANDLMVTLVVREVPSHRHPRLVWWERPLLPMDDVTRWESWPALVDRWMVLRSAGS